MDKPSGLSIGLRIPHFGATASPALVQDFCATAEGLGFDSLWTSDHLAFPRRARSIHSRGTQASEELFASRWSPWYECVATLAYAAGATRRV